MNNYYFTFGQGHIQKDGTEMANYWVRVIAPDEGLARNYFVKHFTSIKMEAPEKWGTSYTQTDFKHPYFPAGEYAVLEYQPEIKKSKKYLLFENEGEIAVEAFSLIGASTKRDDNTKIGFFGSGLKYSIPVLIREGIDFSVFSGDKLVQFTTTPKKMRGMDFDVVCIDGVETSLTTQMGPQWQLWFAIREIYSNMLDESNHDFSIVEDVMAKVGSTRIYVDMSSDKVQAIHDNFFKYFSSFRDDIIYYDADGNAVLESRGKANIYRKGIRCYDEELDSAFDYDFQDLTINESRTSGYGEICYAVANFWAKCDDPKAILRFIESCAKKNLMEAHVARQYHFWLTRNLNTTAWAKALEDKRLVPMEFSGYVDDLNPLKDVFIPNEYYKLLRDKLEKPHDLGFDVTMPYKDCTPTPYQTNMLKRVVEWFELCMTPITYPIEVVNFLDESIFGMAREGKIYLCQKAFIKGKDFVAMVILEEQMHLQHRVKDESRPFQTLLLEHVIYYMSQINANPL